MTNSWNQFSIKHLNIKMRLSETIQIQSRNLFSRSFYRDVVRNYLEWLKDKIHFMMKIFENSRLLLSLKLSFRILGHNSYWEYTYQNIIFQNILTIQNGTVQTLFENCFTRLVHFKQTIVCKVKEKLCFYIFWRVE